MRESRNTDTNALGFFLFFFFGQNGGLGSNEKPIAYIPDATPLIEHAHSPMVKRFFKIATPSASENSINVAVNMLFAKFADYAAIRRQIIAWGDPNDPSKAHKSLLAWYKGTGIEDSIIVGAGSIAPVFRGTAAPSHLINLIHWVCFPVSFLFRLQPSFCFLLLTPFVCICRTKLQCLWSKSSPSRRFRHSDGYSPSERKSLFPTPCRQPMRSQNTVQPLWEPRRLWRNWRCVLQTGWSLVVKQRLLIAILSLFFFFLVHHP